jgi:hypothetical protein
MLVWTDSPRFQNHIANNRRTIEKIFHEAEEYVEDREESYKSTKRWAAALCVIGWELGLFGKLYDVKGSGGGE